MCLTTEKVSGGLDNRNYFKNISQQGDRLQEISGCIKWHVTAWIIYEFDMKHAYISFHIVTIINKYHKWSWGDSPHTISSTISCVFLGGLPSHNFTNNITIYLEPCMYMRVSTSKLWIVKVTQRQYGIVCQQDTYKNMWWGVLMYQQHRSRNHVEIVIMNQAYHEQHIFDHLNESRTQAIYHIGESRIYDGQREISMRHRIPPQVQHVSLST